MTRTKTPARPTPPPGERIIDVDVSDEMRGSFLEYAYSVIYSRALPDARDGLKPVQRRILFQMSQLGLRPDRGHVKCARVVGEVMGRLHPHGDSAIYDALVRMAQPFAMRLPFVDGHGNFGSLDDGPAAMRYTECRLARSAETMTASIDEDVVDFVPNYDGREREPSVLPAAIPALLVNGAAGIAVGMATNIAPHNVGEVCRAAALFLGRRRASLDEIMKLVPGPDFPTGGEIVGLDGVRASYETGRGSFRLRATARIEQVSPKRRGIVITALPFNVGPERVAERIRDLASAKKLDGVANLVDLTDGQQGLRLVIEVKSGFDPEAVLQELFRLTPLEESFNVNTVALVSGQPKTLGLLELLRVFVDHRLDVVRRRSAFRRSKAEDRAHLVDGMLIAVLNIDEVVAVIRSSDDAATARTRLMGVFDLTEAQATHILDMPLRRLTKYSQIELQAEKADLDARIAELTRILDDESVLRSTVRSELLETAAAHDTPRRTVLLGSDEVGAAPRGRPESLEVADHACTVVLTPGGEILRVDGAPDPDRPVRIDVPVRSSVATTTRSEIGVLTSTGLLHRVQALELPAASSWMPDPHPVPVSEYTSLETGESPVAVVRTGPDVTPVAIGTACGMVKRVVPTGPMAREAWELIALRPGDSVVGAGAAPDEAQIVLITSDARLLRFKARLVRPQGRGSAGVAGIKLSPGSAVTCFAIADQVDGTQVATLAGPLSLIPGTGPCSVKVTALNSFPAKGRATGGVRCHRFLKGENALVGAWVADRLLARSISGTDVAMPEPAPRDASGVKIPEGIAEIGSAWP